MNCPCGNPSLTPRDATHRHSQVRYTLSFHECGQCGRIGNESLRQEATVIARNEPARKAFQQLTTHGVAPDLSLETEHGACDTRATGDSGEPAGTETSTQQELSVMAEASEYRPYKYWFTPARRRLKVLSVWIEPDTALVAIPELEILERGTDLIDTAARASRAVKDALGFDDPIRKTCAPAFTAQWPSTPVAEAGDESPCTLAQPNHHHEPLDTGEQLSLF